MNSFIFKEPKLYKDKDNKKWCVRYSIKYTGEKNYIPIKEYGRLYFHKSLNTISDLKQRQLQFDKLLTLVERDLKNGIILRQPETLKVLDDKVAYESKKRSYDECLNLYLKIKGYINPIFKKERSAEVIESFHRNQFRPFLEKKGLTNDITKIGKAEILEFMNFYFFHSDPDIKWENNTFNIKKALLSTFFSTMVDEDIIEDNPAKKVKSKPKQSSEKFELYTREERDILFNHLESSDKKKFPFMAAISKSIYYSYIRETELSRLLVSDFDLEKRRIRIHPDNAKGQKNLMVRFVKMPLPMQEALQVYLSKYEHQPNYYMFGKGYKPSRFRTGTDWTEDFGDEIDKLRVDYPGKFDRMGLTPYALKHSGVTDFINDNIATKSTTQLYQFVQSQCRHEKFETTQLYFKRLELDIEVVDTFEFI